MSPIFRLAIAAAAGYLVHQQAARYTTATDPISDAAPTERFSPRGKFFLGLGAALLAWWVLPKITGGERPRGLAAHARRMLSAPLDDSDCGCDA
ncbi:MAG: hypothetical protein WC700_17525 [Gemmatimonadaceae bacterium]|jgi:hypothetical protein